MPGESGEQIPVSHFAESFVESGFRQVPPMRDGAYVGEIEFGQAPAIIWMQGIRRKIAGPFTVHAQRVVYDNPAVDDVDVGPLRKARSEERRVGKECRSRWS